ncbi:MAG: pyridoxamine 5'-phosphate oxidase family protein [Pseudomonadota bacterium]
MPTADEFYTESQRAFQKDHDSFKLANAVVDAIVSDDLDDKQTAFVESRDFFFLSTVNGHGEPSVSYKGGPVGVVRVVSPTQLVFPNYDGNGMFYSMGNTAETGKVGLLFIDFETPNRLRIQGDASISKEPAFVDRFPGANMVVKVDITSVFVNCARYIHKHQRLETSKYVPDEKGEQPFPAWKRIEAIQDALPAKDQGRAGSEGGTISFDDYEDHVAKGTS